MKKNIEAFPVYILRTSLLPLNYIFDLFSKDVITKENYKEIFDDHIVKEAVFLASPVLHSELNKWFSNKISNNKRIEKIQSSFLKYLTRASSRCTPFGLFAGVSAGIIGKETKIEINDIANHGRRTLLDMNYAVDLVEYLSKDSEIKKRILYYPNSSIYKLGFDFRYLEYYFEKGRRKHLVSSLLRTEYLEKVFAKAASGATFRQLCQILKELDVGEELAEEYISKLIENGFLVNELEPYISGPDFLNHIVSIMEKYDDTDRIKKIRFNLSDIKVKLNNLDKRLGNDIKLYQEIIKGLEEFDVEINEKYLFQTDLKINLKNNCLSSEVSDSVAGAITFLNKITKAQSQPRLDKFYKKFIERYGDREVSLANALDVETGIEYNTSLANDVNILVDDLVLPDKSSDKQILYSDVNDILLRKVVNTIHESQYTLRLYDDDFDEFKPNWDSVCPTIYSMVKIVKCDGRQKIVLGSTGGINGAMLLTRFGHIDSKIEKFINEVVDYEEKADKSKIYAEVVHLPESRVGNILRRPLLRKYEIPYMAKSILPVDKQIPIQDLLISANNGKIVLRSKSLKKEIVPRITSAHNFEKTDTLPVYQFLADLQSQDKHIFMHILNSMSIVNNFDFIPRIEYRDVILYEATWNLYEKDIRKIKSFDDSEEGIMRKVRRYREEKKIPRFTRFVEGDNQLMIDFENHNSINLFLDAIKNKKRVILQEFTGVNETVVNNGKNKFCNEIILAFKILQ